MNPLNTYTWIPLTFQEEGEDLIQIESAKDEFFYDKDGNEWIDGISSWWTIIFGHRHPRIMEAIRAQTMELDHIILAGNTHTPSETLSKKILELTSFEFHKVFYSDNGSNAVEIALKLAIQYYKNIQSDEIKVNALEVGSQSERSKFIVFSNSYHGDSIGAMNVSGLTYFNRVFKELRFPTTEFPAPNCSHCPFQLEPKSCSTECLDSLEVEILTRSYAGIVVEPLVFGASGMVFYDAKVLKRLRELADNSNTLFIFDEVFTGMGRLGKPFAYQVANVQPDLLAMAKGLTGGSLPLAATLVTQKVYSKFVTKDPILSFFHAHTMTGNPIACSAGIAAVDLLVESGPDLVRRLEGRLKKYLSDLQERLENKLENPRVLGAICAFEWTEEVAEDEYLNPTGKKISRLLREKRILLRPLGRTIYITPPYTISEDSLKKIFSALYEVLSSFA